MRTYHGSYMKIVDIDLSKCEPYRDFGKGFYVTNIREQAEYWAARKGHDNGTDGCITEFDFIEAAFDNWKFRVLRFDNYTGEWLDFVVMNRNRRLSAPVHDYDIVEGPVADDKVAQRIDTYLEGVISKETFLEELKFFRHTHQICLCTQRSLQAIERIDKKKYIGNIDEAITQALVTDFGMAENTAIDAYFDSQTYQRLIDENTKLHEKPFTDVYEMLKQELKKKNRR
jgi:hypothetical protein